MRSLFSIGRSMGDRLQMLFEEEGLEPPTAIRRGWWKSVRSVSLILMALIIGADWSRHSAFSCRRWCFLTNWTFDVLVISTVLSVIVPKVYWSSRSRAAHVLMQVSATSSITVTLIYWSVIFTTKDSIPSTPTEWMADFGVHLLNSVITIADICMTRRVFFRNHWVFGSLFLMIYFSFSSVYGLISGEQFYEVVPLESYSDFVNAFCFGVTVMVIQRFIHAFLAWRTLPRPRFTLSQTSPFC